MFAVLPLLLLLLLCAAGPEVAADPLSRLDVHVVTRKVLTPHKSATDTQKTSVENLSQVGMAADADDAVDLPTLDKLRAASASCPRAYTRKSQL